MLVQYRTAKPFLVHRNTPEIPILTLCCCNETTNIYDQIRAASIISHRIYDFPSTCTKPANLSMAVFQITKQAAFKKMAFKTFTILMQPEESMAEKVFTT